MEWKTTREETEESTEHSPPCRWYKHNDWLAESITPSAEGSFDPTRPQGLLLVQNGGSSRHFEVAFDHTAIMAGGTYNGAQCNDEFALIMTDGFLTAEDNAFCM